MIKTIVKNDLLFLRPWLLVWGGILLAAIVPFAVLRTPLGWDEGYWSIFPLVFGIAFLLQIFCQFILITKMIRKESLVNTRAYWMTRPMPRGQLVFTKLGLILGVLILPQLLQFGLMGACFPGGWEGAGRAIIMILVLALFISIFALVSACVTKDSRQAILAAFLIPILLVLSGSLLRKIFAGTPWLMTFFTSLGQSIITQIILITVGVALLLLSFWRHYHQPLLRWRHRLHYLAALALLTMGAMTTPPSPLPEGMIPLPKEAQLTVGYFQFGRMEQSIFGSRSRSSGSSSSAWQEGGKSNYLTLLGVPTWQGLPEAYILKVRALRSFSPDGKILPVAEERGMSLPFEEIPAGVLKNLFPNSIMQGGRIPGGSSQNLFSSQSLEVDKIQLPATFSTVFATHFYRAHKERIEMDSSRCFQIGQTRMIIQSTERRGGNWVLNCKYLTPGIGPNNSEETIEGSLVLRDPVTNQISLGSSGLRSESSFGRLIKTGEVEIEFANLNSQTGFSELELYHIREELVGIDVREVDYEVTE